MRSRVPAVVVRPLSAMALLLLLAAAPAQAQAPGPPLSLYPGWTNLAYDGETLPVEETLTTAASAIEAIWHWDAPAQTWTAFFPGLPLVSTLPVLHTGFVYWVRASSATDWAPPRAILFQRGQIEVTPAGSPALSLTVDLAATAAQRGRGLMWRRVLGPDDGMLFVFAGDSSGGFWMRNTFIPLSIAFIDAEGRIVSIHDLEPLSTTIVGPGAPYRWALEMNRGWFAEHGVGPGDAVVAPAAPS